MTRRDATSRFVAFLRGINVGGHRVSMERLRDLFRDLGFSDVATFIASGNVIFESTATDDAVLEKRIEAHLERSLGYRVDTMLRTPTELASVVAFRPFAPDELAVAGNTLHVGFLRAALDDAAAQKMLTFCTEMDDFRVHGRELYWLCRGKITDSLVSWPLVAKEVPVTLTMRNITTIRKLSAKHPPGSNG